jgi:alkylation response protein AidB-like acyl-CoA dehydrogenase
MDFGFSEEQEELRETVRDFFANEAPIAYARGVADGDAAEDSGATPELWNKMAELGWLGITVPVEHGGSGLGAVELVIVMEEAGRVVLPGPLLSTLALAVPAISAHGTAEQAGHLLPGLVDGSRRATMAVAEAPAVWGAAGIETVAVRDGEGLRLTGTKLFVPDARDADTLIVLAGLDGGFGLVALPAGTAGVRVERMQTVDQTRKLDVVMLDDVCVGTAECLLGGAAIDEAALDALVDIEKIALAAELCGAADAALAMSVDYLQIREQFGRKLATFQSLQHKLADMKVLLENSRSLTYYAAWATETGAEDRRMACAMAKSYAGEGCTRVVADAIQAHGGVGFTWEHDLHLYLKRSKANEVVCGDPTESRELVAALLDL